MTHLENSLHSNIINFNDPATRVTSSIDAPLLYEDRNISPVLFPKYGSVVALNADLLSSGSAYDKKNPNIITRLIPPHYLLEGRDFEGMKTVDGQISDAFTGGTNPRTGKMGSVQLITSMLLVWAKYFDELKMFLDHISSVIYILIMMKTVT